MAQCLQIAELNPYREMTVRSLQVLSTITLGSLLATQATGQDDAVSSADPYAQPDDTRISISGTVASPTPDSFSLDYGDGTITVEIGDWKSYRHAYALMDGDRVTVHGQVDENLFQRDTIEARSVYVESLNAYFHASAADADRDGYMPYSWAAPESPTANRATIRGTVNSVEPNEGEFTVDRGNRQITIETETLGYDPLDDLGFQKIEEGDTVSVSGQFDSDFLEGRVLDADKVISLFDADDDSSRVAMPSVTH